VIRTAAQIGGDVACALGDREDEYAVSLELIEDQVFSDRPETDLLVGQIFSSVPGLWVAGQDAERITQFEDPSVGRFSVIAGDVLSDVIELLAGFLAQDVIAHAMRFLRWADLSAISRSKSSAVTNSPRLAESIRL
jgi:hypothetical protein